MCPVRGLYSVRARLWRFVLPPFLSLLVHPHHLVPCTGSTAQPTSTLVATNMRVHQSSQVFSNCSRMRKPQRSAEK